MTYTSTRSVNPIAVSAAEAIKRGLAPDGGLYMPSEIPTLSHDEIGRLASLTYPERAAFVIGKFLTDYSEKELLEDACAAYSEEKFPGGAAPLADIDSSVTALELWHGPTCAFKDMALQIMPRLLSRALKKTGEKRTAMILVATSGDTGKAALEGYRDVEQTKIKVFYPVDGVSRVQKLQMMTQLGENVGVCAIKGNFDDAQTGVKKIFSCDGIAKSLDEKGVFLSSANSINWGRLVPQIVYYVSAYCDMVASRRIAMGEIINVCVPTGNFGNILAAYFAKRMGLPIGKLICASNANHVLTDFLNTGTYDRNRPFHTTISPSMDILISSNLERLLFLAFGAERCASLMRELSENGCYSLTSEELSVIQADFCGYYCDEEKTRGAIQTAWHRHHYLCDTHTAVGYGAALEYLSEEGSGHRVLLASTASPYKFACDVYQALLDRPATDDLAALDELARETSTEIPAPLSGIGSRALRFSDVISPEEMASVTLAFAD